jgi:hypothetical protein
MHDESEHDAGGYPLGFTQKGVSIWREIRATFHAVSHRDQPEFGERMVQAPASS